jgi:two-component system, NtrC family, sensor kinase
MASLFVIRGRDQGRQILLAEARMQIGRDNQSQLQLLDSEVSRQHAVIDLVPDSGNDTYELVDLGSSNGTYVNGQLIQRHRLRSGDRVQIGRTVMIFTGSSAPEGWATTYGVEISASANPQDASQIVASVQSDRHREAIEPAEANSSVDRPLQLMVDVSLAVGRTLEIPELLDRILQLVFDWVGADRGCIMLQDPDTGSLRPAARRDRRGSAAAGRMEISRTILDYVISRKEAVRVSDARDDQRFDAAASIVSMGIHEALCVPLQGRYGIVGALYIDTFTSPMQLAEQGRDSRFTDDHLRLLVAIGHQAALAIEDTFYYSSLVQSERLAAIGQTIATLSHHIKNILQGLRGGGYLINAGVDREDMDAIRRGWRIVERNQERISHLVLDMLSLSKERPAEAEPGHLPNLLADVLELAQPRAAEVGVQLHFQSPTMPIVMFDHEALHRAVLNIVLNAIDAVVEKLEENVGSPWVGEVTLRCGFEVDMGVAWIEVVDNGPGIAAEDLEKIFAPFESDKGSRGTGLGLPVSRKVLREHGGDITVASTVGEGSRFMLRWPSRTNNADTHAL